MKKLILLIPALLFMLTGCGTVETGTISCTLNSKDVVNGYEIESKYKINYTGDYVDVVNTVETVISETESILDYFETTLNDTYAAMSKSYGGYTYDIINENGKVVSNVTIDYNKMDLNQFVLDQPTMKTYVENDKFLVEGIKALYESMGATCE